jgi:hypothetical protein
VARRTLILRRELLAAGERARQHVRRPRHPRVTRFGPQIVVRDLDDLARGNRHLRAALVRRHGHVHAALQPHLRRRLRFHDLDAARVRLLREILRGGQILFARRQLGETDHDVGVRLPRIGAFPQPVPEILHLLHEVGGVIGADRRVLGPTRAVGEVAQRALAHVGLPEAGDVGNGPVPILGVPIHRFLLRPQLPARERFGRAGDRHVRGVVGRQRRRWRWSAGRRRRRIRPVGKPCRNRRARSGGGLLLRQHGCPENHAGDSDERTHRLVHGRHL